MNRNEYVTSLYTAHNARHGLQIPPGRRQASPSPKRPISSPVSLAPPPCPVLWCPTVSAQSPSRCPHPRGSPACCLAWPAPPPLPFHPKTTKLPTTTQLHTPFAMSCMTHFSPPAPLCLCASVRVPTVLCPLSCYALFASTALMPPPPQLPPSIINCTFPNMSPLVSHHPTLRPALTSPLPYRHSPASSLTPLPPFPSLPILVPPFVSAPPPNRRGTTPQSCSCPHSIPLG